VSTVTEVASGLAFLLAQLRGNATLMSLSPGGVQIGSADIGSEFPCTLINFQSGIDMIFGNGKRAYVDALYQVKAVGPADDPDVVVALASAIDDALGGDEGLKHVSVTGGHILRCSRTAPLFYPDQVAGTKYMHMGGIWNIKNQQKPV
jgi:hypothetical protein